MNHATKIFTLLLMGSAPLGINAAGPLEGYSNHQAFLARTAAIAASPVAEVKSLATTLGNREVLLITLGQNKNRSRPAILIVGNVAAPHLVGGEIALGLAEWIVAHVAEDSVRTLLESTTLFIIPRPNPDGVEKLFQPPFYEADGNARKTDDDRDFLFGEDPPDDLDGNGIITQMRVADSAGTHRPHPDEPRLMIPADPAKGEVGTHRLYSEGIDQDHDEKWNEDPGQGVSFNQNFPAKYAFFAKGAGSQPVSELESRAVADFCFDHPEIMAIVTIGPEDNLFFPPKPGGEEKIKTKIQTADAPIHEHFAKRFQEISAAKPPAAPLDSALAVGSGGSFADWAYLQWGRWSFTTRGWWIPPAEPAKKEEKPAEPPANEKKKDDRDAEGRRSLDWMQENKITGFVPWTKINHPDFPGQSVEVGGFQPFVRSNPPSSLLPELARKHALFVIEVARAAPRLVVLSQTIDRPPPGNVARLRVKLSNAGLLPTMSAMAKIADSATPINWKWNLPKEAKLLAGTLRGQTEPISAGGEATIEALILIDKATTAPITLTVESPAITPIDPIRFEFNKEAAP
jgi:hypothetical protein